MTLPYLFLTIAFPFFKAKTHLDRPFVIFKNRPSTLLATGASATTDSLAGRDCRQIARCARPDHPPGDAATTTGGKLRPDPSPPAPSRRVFFCRLA
ncbi:hypothetical protein, partial [Klebsiella pneumoniae]|uniref:hypothetical protein n=1 Tax=Klebsiella pneumoniae TaxID=573 RepID=UPI00210D8916